MRPDNKAGSGKSRRFSTCCQCIVKHTRNSDRCLTPMSTQHKEQGLRLAASRSRNKDAGFSLVELMVVFTIMTIALSMFSQTLTSASRLDPLSKQKSAASNAAQNIIETMRGYEFTAAFKNFNLDGADDPGGAGTSPGKYFDVLGLEPIAPGVQVGEIIFCDFEGVIREDSDMPEFGLPRDLNADGIVDREVHTDDCIIIPFKVVVQWTSRYGARKFEMYGALSDL